MRPAVASYALVDHDSSVMECDQGIAQSDFFGLSIQSKSITNM